MRNEHAHTDVYGTPLKVGQYVAYNYSGDIAVGTVLSLHRGHRYGWQYCFIKVEQDNGHVSTVRNLRGVLVLP